MPKVGQKVAKVGLAKIGHSRLVGGVFRVPVVVVCVCVSCSRGGGVFRVPVVVVCFRVPVVVGFVFPWWWVSCSRGGGFRVLVVGCMPLGPMLLRPVVTWAQILLVITKKNCCQL